MTSAYARRVAALRGEGKAASPADGATVEALRGLLAESLGVAADALDPARPFAEQGLTSLLAVRFLDRVNRRFGLKLGVEVLFAHASLAALAAHVAPRTAASPAMPAEPTPRPGAMDIAVIGMAGRFPGAPDIAALHARLAEGALLVGPMPADRLARPVAAPPGVVAGFLSGIDRFDAGFFGISPREAAAMDPQQRLFLEQCWLAIENAGIPAERLRGARVGVFAGAAASGYEAMLPADAPGTQSHALTGNLVSLLAARIAYALDLRGPAMVVDTACSASLVAIHLACQALRAGEAEMAIAGGVRLFLDTRSFAAMQRVGMLSPAGRCRSFDAAADGIAVGEAAAAVLLKPLARALADGDRIDAVIRGTGTNQDGRSNGITAPNGRAQAELIRDVLDKARIAPATIGLVEAHGTGTPLGDPIEVAALAEVLGDRATPAWLGSIKSNIGHTSEAAGVAGLIKAALCLREAEILPSIGYDAPNPRAAFGTSLRVATARQPWPAGAPRRAALSSFGLSGTNAHAVLDAAPEAAPRAAGVGPWLVVLSGADAEAPRRNAARLAAWLRGPGAAARLDDLCRTLLDGRSAMDHRIAFVAPDRDALLAALDAPPPVARVPRGAVAEADPATLATLDDATRRPAALAALAEAWRAGARIPGARLYPLASRALDLPGYAFAAEAHWAAREEVAPEPGRITFTADDPLVRDHVVAGAALLHAALFLDLAQREAARSGVAATRLADIAWLRPATVPAGGALHLRLGLGDGLVSMTPEGEMRPVARGRLGVAGVAPAALDLPALRAGATRIVQRTELPQGGAVHLGPSYPGFATLFLAPGRALARVVPPAARDAVGPALSDAAIQVAVALLAAEAPEGAAAIRYPAELAALDLFAALPDGEAWILAEPRGGDAVDLLVCDAAGTPVQRWQGLVLRAAPAPRSAETATPAPAFHATAWVARDAAPGLPALPQLAIAAEAESALLPPGTPRFDPTEEARIEAALGMLDRGGSPCLWLVDGGAEAAEPVGAFALRRLVAALVRQGFEHTKLRLRIVTTLAEPLPGDTAPPRPIAAVTQGLAKAVAAEFPAWRVTICDVDPAAPPSVAALAAEPGAASAEPVALRADGRFERVLRTATLPAARLSAGAAFVVIGGMGRVGRALCRDLAAQGARLMLVGRAALDAGRAAFLAELGPDARYHAADIAAPGAAAAVLDAAEAAFGPLAGVVQAVVDPVFGRTDRMPEAEFRAALRPKVAGLAALAAALEGREGAPVLTVFSSIGAFRDFPGTAGQPSYAAACSYEAAYVRALQAQGRRAQLIHWGLWRNEALNPAMVARLAADGCTVQDEAASARVAAALLAAPTDTCVVHAALSPAVWTALGAEDPADPATLAATARDSVAPAPEDTTLHAAMEAHARALLAETLHAAGLLPAIGESRALDKLREAWGASAPRAALADALVEMLVRAGDVALQDGAVVTLAPPSRPDAATRRASLLAAGTGDAMQVALGLLEPCVAAVPDILAGRVAATEILFPGGSTDRVAPLYRTQPLLAACNAAVAAAAERFAAARPGAALRVVEIGAGTGATTTPVIQALQQAGIAFDYRVTDLSAALLREVRARHQDVAGVSFTALDIARPPATQGLAEGEADLVIASDVLHATADIAQSLAHAAALLKPGGVLLLNETTRRDDVATLTFGLLDGWWLARDAARRMPHAPLLSAEGWADALREAGFDAVAALPAPGTPAGAGPAHTVLIARQAGRTTAATPAVAKPAAAPSRRTAPLADTLTSLIAGCVGAALELAPERIEADAPFGEIGVDSIVAPQIAEDIAARLGISLRSTDLYNFGSVAALAKHIAQSFPDALAKLPAADAAPVPAAATPSVAMPMNEPIAIIGIAGRYPGAPDLDAFWQMIEAGRDAVKDVDRFDLSPVLGAKGEKGRAYARWAALLEDHDRFDPLFFGISPAEAEAMEPQQRLLLEEGWRALEDAGLPPERLAGRRCGVFVGVSASNYVAGAAPAALQTLGGSTAILSARLSYLLDLQGPCFPVDTGCSSSLVALHLAIESLRRGESEVALAAGVSCNIISPHLFLYLSDSGMASPTGRCHTFDAAADGFVPGEGVGCLVLKPLAAALADGDRIHAVIRGAGINQDGRTSGLTAPSATSQTALEVAVYRAAGVDPETIGLIEAHGTGTKLGDPIEIAALTDAFAAFTPRKRFCAIGSVKTNIGHAMAAAGMAGVAKAVLALKRRRLPPTLNFRTPNPHIDFDATPFVVNTTSRDWAPPAPGMPRRAAVSSFGFSGTNAHVVIEEAPEGSHATPPAPGARVLPVSARSAAALKLHLHALADALAAPDAPALADVAFTLACRRGHFRHRRAIVVRDVAAAPALLRAAAERPSRAAPPADADPVAAVAAAWARGEAAQEADLDLIAVLHEGGATLDWAALADGRRRLVTLPGHPFLRDRFWGFDPTAGLLPAPQAPAPAEFHLTDDLPLLRDHRVQGRALLPGTVLIERLRATAAAALGTQPGALLDIAWLAPAVAGMRIAGTTTRDGEALRVELRDAASGQVLARATAVAGAVPARDVATNDAACTRRMDTAAIYTAFAGLGFAYGPSLRVLAEVALGDGVAVARLRPAEAAPGTLDAAALDGALQAAALIGLGAAAPDRSSFVPAGLDRVALHALPRPGEALTAEARLRPDATAEAPAFDVWMLGEGGRVLTALEGVRARRLPAAERIGVQAFVPAWTDAPLPADRGGVPGDVLLLGGTPALAAALRATLPGHRVLHAEPGAEGLRMAGPDLAEADLADPSALGALLAAAAPAAAPLVVVNALRLTPAPAPVTLGAALAAAGIEDSVRPLMLLARAALTAERGPLALLHLEAAETASGAAVGAFFRSLAGETGRILGRVLIGADASAIAAELRAPWTGPAEIRLADDGLRLARGFVPATLPATPASWVRPGSTWLIAGGLGGLGLALARHLAEAGAARIALLSRRAPGADDTAALAAIEAKGATVLPVQADLADASSLRVALALVRRSLGPLHGLVQAAGVLRDARVAQLSPADLDAVLAPKVAGTIALDHLTATDPLEAVLLFSSTAAALGAPGQAAYAAANGFLGGFAAWRAAEVAAGRRRGATLAVDWPLWEGGGMAPPVEVVAELDRRLGLLPMPAATGIAAIGSALALGAPHLALLHGRVPHVGAAFATRGTTPRPASAPVAAVDAAAVEAYLARLLAEVIRLPVERLDPEERLEEYGLDSIGIMRLNTRLEADLGDISKTLFFEHRTVRELAPRLLRDHGAALAKLLAPATPAPDAAAPPPATPAIAGVPAARPAQDAASGAIAIIGIAGTYPDAPDLDAFWRNLRAGRDCIREIPPERWPLEGFYDPERNRPETSYAKWGGFIEGADCFDARFFGISPVEADSLDPQARKFLETCWAAIEDAGLTRATLFRGDAKPEARRGGVFVGVMNGDYALFGAEEAVRGNLIGPNAAYWNIANRVSWILDLHGPCMAVDTACSASLSAIHAACQAIRAGECSVALAGGVNLILHPSRYWILSKSGFASSDGRCRSFGAGGDGYVPGEGVGAVLLKPLDRALADGDRIHAVIRGGALNHGGRSGGFTVPDPTAQAALIEEALERAGTPPATISFIEAHGTGTALGDPVEVTGLGRAFAGLPPASLPVGSVKSAIGHLEAAAGIAGLTKVVLQLRHGELAPSLHAETLNPDLGLARTPLVVQRDRAPWPRPAHAPRRAGISSFGAGGSNAHLVVEEAPAQAAPPPLPGPYAIPLSAATPAGLVRVAAGLAAWLRAAETMPPLADIARTLQVGREAMRHRAAFVAATAEELLAGLDAIATGRPEGIAAGDVRRDASEAAPHGLPAAEISRLWATGAARIAWDAVAPGRRPPVSLPTYPFEKRRCWVQVTPRGRAPLALPGGITLDAADDAGQRAIRIAPDAPVLAEHRVGGRAILPGALLLALMLRATGGTALGGIRFRRPADEAAIATGLTLTASGDAIALRAGTSVLADARADADAAVTTPPDAATLLPGCTRVIAGAEAYALLAGAGADYAGGFRRLAEVHRGDGVAVARLDFGARDWAEALDAAFQLTFALLPEDGAAGPFLPAGLDRLDITGQPGRVARIAARRRSADAETLLLDIALEDEAGAAQATLHGFAARRLAAPPAAPLPPLEAWRAVWETAPPVAPAPTGERACLLAPGADPAISEALGAALGITPADQPELSSDAIWLLVRGAGDDPAARADAAVLHLAGLVRDLAARPRPPRLVVVTVGAHRALPGETPCPVAAAIAAFARAVGREQPELRLALLDIVPDAALAATVPTHAAPGADLALRPAMPPLRRRFVALDLEQAGPSDPGGAVLVAGGAGGLGRTLAEHLARTRRARVALLGRSAPTAAVQATLARCASLGGQAIHLRADLTDAAQLDAALAEAEARLGPVGLVVHAAMELRDGRIATQPDAEIARVLAPKTRGLAALTAALARRESGRAPARLLLFSSANAETANPGQAAYAAASAFADAFALGAGRPALVVDWGFWGEVGAVATDAHRAALARIGVHPIGTAEGFALLDRMLASPALDRAMPLRVSPEVAAELGADPTRRIAVPATAAALLPPAIAAASARQARDGSVLDGAADGFAAMNALAARLAHASLAAANLPATRIAPAQRRLHAAIEAMRERAGLAGTPAEDPATLEAAGAALIAADPAAAPYLRLLRICTTRLPEVLTGATDANEVLFPGGSLDLVAPIYAGNAVVDHLQALLADAVAAAVVARLAEGAARVRVLEVGAGTGGSTRFVLRALAPFADRVDYVFTDIGPAFLEEAERSLKPDAPYLTTARLDIATPPASQGFAPGEFDVVIAANVLHATPRLAATLAHASALLRPGGLLAVNEAVAAQDFNTLTFGLTRGWWAFEDAEARLPHAPLLDPPRWRAALAAAGFAGTAVIGEARLQAVLLAAADPLALPAAPPAPTPRSVAVPTAGTSGEAIETRLRETVAAALRLTPEEVEPETSFAEYGADSIISVELVRRINDAFGIELKTTALFNYATVRELAAYIRLEHSGGAAPAPEAEAVTERILDQKERAGRLRSMIKRHLEAKGAAPAPAPEPEASDLTTLLRRLESGEIRYEDAMTARLTDG